MRETESENQRKDKVNDVENFKDGKGKTMGPLMGRK